MAALGKIRSKGTILIIVIGLGLFAFIAEELVRSCESTHNENRQQIGKVLGKKIGVNEYQKLVDEYNDVVKFTQGRDNLSDAELNQIKDAAWQTLVQNMIIEDEAKKVGLTVTDKELQDVLNQGTNQLLLQTPFKNEQTGRFDANLLKKFIAEYKQAQENNPQLAEQYQPLYNFWTFVEKNLRAEILSQKYQGLLAACLLSNPVSAKMAYTDNNEESRIILASFPYSSINDNDVEVSDAELNAKYNEMKQLFKTTEETRDIKYVSYKVTASTPDRKALDKEIADATAQLIATDDPASVVRKAVSSIPYIGIPQTKAAFPSDIAAQLDSVAVGKTTAPKENKRDNTLNAIRLISKQQLPDSVEFRVIQVAAQNIDDARKRADSIYTALKGGADFETIAKKYGQTGEKTWLTSKQYENATSIDKDTRNYLTTLNTSATGELTNLEVTSGNIIMQVTDRRAFTDKYVAAVIKRPIDFSKDTYSSAYNKFSQFVSENTTTESMVKAAKKYGYTVRDREGVSNTSHYIANIHGSHDALKWVFEAKEGEVSPLYECGDNDCLLVVMMTKVNKKGYLTLDNDNVREYIRSLVRDEKKAEMLKEKAEGITSIAAAKDGGAKIDTIRQITFGSPAFLQTTGTSEPALSGAVAATEKGKFCATPITGNGGIFLFSVEDKSMTEGEEYNEQDYEQRTRNTIMQYASNFMQQLYVNAEITDNRYLFF